MKRFAFLLIFGPLFPMPAAAVTATSTPNAYMVENTPGLNPQGAQCYDFITTPACSASITGLSTTTFASIYSSSNTWTGINTFTSTTAVNGPMELNGSFGTAGQALVSNQTGAPSWSSVAALSSSNTWTGTQNFVSPQASTINVLNVGTMTVAGFQGYMLLYSSTVYDLSGSSATTSATFVPTKTAITITPKRTTSRIEISFVGALTDSAGSTTSAFATLNRGSTNLATGTNAFCITQANVAGTVRGTCAGSMIDIPNTTSAITYTVNIKSGDGVTTATWTEATVGAITVKEWGY